MFYDVLKVGEKEYKLRLSTKEMKNLKEALGGVSPIKAFEKMGEENDIDYEFIANVIFHAMKKEQPKIKLDNVYDILDEMADEGKSIEDYLAIVVQIFSTCGMLPKEAYEEYVKSLNEDSNEKK